MSDATTQTASTTPHRASLLPPGQRPNVFPAMRYRDADTAMRWLEETLGFLRTQVYRNEDGSVAHAELALDAATVMVSSAKEDDLRLLSPRDLGGATTCCLCVWRPEIETLAERIRRCGVALVYGPRDTHYGSRELAVRDPEGQLWVFGTYYPGDAG